MKRDYNFYIKDILQSIIQIEKFVEGMDYEEFLHDEKTTVPLLESSKSLVRPPSTSLPG